MRSAKSAEPCFSSAEDLAILAHRRRATCNCDEGIFARVKLEQASVEQARYNVDERLNRMKLREDKARADRGERDQLHQTEAAKTARLRALRLARIAADTCASARETTGWQHLSPAVAGR